MVHTDVYVRVVAVRLGILRWIHNTLLALRKSDRESIPGLCAGCERDSH